MLTASPSREGRTDTANTAHSHVPLCLDPVQLLDWSPDSCLLLCAMFKRGVVQVTTPAMYYYDNYRSMFLRDHCPFTSLPVLSPRLSPGSGVVDRATRMDVQDRRGLSWTSIRLLVT